MKTVALYRPNFMDEFDHYMESFFGNMPIKSAASLLSRGLDFPAVDLRETDATYLLDAELPGYDEKNIEVHVDGARLTIESKQAKAETTEKDESNYIIHERRQRSFSRIFQLPDNADPNAVSATFKNGVLSLEIKKQTESQKRVIQING
ncbi:MAG: Hsp20/alpha crystallin family protein [Treponema sp.]|jgi:HSP20 family protein|nr:Hsp20/alpha crystallin family protein [Treponema sp.]